ncbi:CDP-2,3-bis-(O-geranylgeranyl)-sn-glycerol synthase [Candidatus Micrarchaeota archaeon]|nr:CDP-2,3-bis-(O-geranylgeranyl)-sn-glycerol synthase [Candidatus Micrarchaeota archaeon]
MLDLNGIFSLLIFLIPPYIANSSPVVLGGGAPLDQNIKLGDGQRLFGDGKTIRGFLGGTIAGAVAGGIVALYYPLPFFPNPQVQFIAGFALAFGTLFGDAAGSFIKRRTQTAPGRPFILDSVAFLFFALLFTYPFASSSLYDLQNLAFFLVLTLIIHPLTNALANKAGLKNVPW